MVTPDRYVKLEKKKEKQLAIEFGRKRKFVHKAEVKRLAAASCKDNNSLPKKMTTIKAGKSGNFVHVFCTHISLQQLFSHPVKTSFYFINLH